MNRVEYIYPEPRHQRSLHTRYCDRIFNNIGTTTIEARKKVHAWFLVGFGVLNLEFSV